MDATPAARDRPAVLDALRSARLDVLVIGGGIVGAGVARDAAMRGLRVGLVEQRDFASGTSSRSSRLLHGGLRYLAQGRLGLVREASREKWVLHRIAPHLCQPLVFVFPTYRRSVWPRWRLGLGVKLYDILCGGRNLGPSSVLSAAEVDRLLPQPAPKDLTGAVRYFDALTNDARLVLDTLRSAAAHGAMVANYVRLDEAAADAGFWRCTARDAETGRELPIEARCVVHAAGPWAERLPASSIRLRLTKGVHLVIDRLRLPVPDAVVMTDGPRILFAIPWGQRVILGTTDTDYDGPLDEPPVDFADVESILAVVNRAFPAAGLTASDVGASWAGLRPLIAGGRGGPSDISRHHEIRMARPGWFDVAGGKLTTYRLIAEQVVDRVEKHLGRRVAACRTADEPLVRADEARGLSGILPPPVERRVVERHVREEWAMHLDDVMIRRAGWHFYEHQPEQVAAVVAGWMAELLGCDAARTAAELQRYRTQSRAVPRRGTPTQLPSE